MSARDSGNSVDRKRKKRSKTTHDSRNQKDPLIDSFPGYLGAVVIKEEPSADFELKLAPIVIQTEEEDIRSSDVNPPNDSFHDELRRFMKQISRDNKNAQAAIIKRLDNLQQDVTNLRNEIRERAATVGNQDDHPELEVHTKINSTEDFLAMEEKFLSNSKDDIASTRQMSSMLAPQLHIKRGYSNTANSLAVSMLTEYFDGSFLKTLGWSGKDGRTSLFDKSGHLAFFFFVINKAAPNTFPTLVSLNRSFSIAMKRMRERERKQSAGVKSEASHHSLVDKTEPSTSKSVVEESSESSEESDSEDEQQIKDRRQLKKRCKIDSDWSPFDK